MPRPPKPRSQPTRLRKGAIAVIGALLAVLLLSCAALMIDISYIQLTGIELQSAADAAALAGVTKLPTSNDAAVAEAKSFATKNVAASQSVSSDCVFASMRARTSRRGGTCLRRALILVCASTEVAWFGGSV